MIDWDFVNKNWGDILQKAREHETFKQEMAFDDNGNLFITPQRPMLESLICDKVELSHRLEYYLQVLGYPCKPGREIRIGIGSRMPMAIVGRGEKKK